MTPEAPDKWELVAIGLLTMATVLAGGTALGGLEIALRLGPQGPYATGNPFRIVLLALFVASIGAHIFAWGFGLMALFGESYRKKDNARYAGYAVLAQVVCASFMAWVVLLAAFRAS